MRGRDIKRYAHNWAGLYLIATFPAKHYDIEAYPAVRDYLLTFGKERLEQTGRNYHIDGKVIRARKATHNQWFEMQDSIRYSDDFFEQKIVYSEIVSEPQFYFDRKGEFFPEGTTFIMVGERLEYLIKLLNSRIVGYIFKNFYAGGMLGENYRYKEVFLHALPLPKYGEIETKDESRIEEKICKLYGFNTKEKEYILQKIN